MSMYLGQLPPAELARLKAELAETLIASFCYPRFYDYRTGTLRMRPVDRSRRQEVWLYLSSIDFTAWNRVDVLSPDFQYHIERLFIQFVQRNRSFFGEQGRKRLSDVRMLITTRAATVAEDLRSHLTGQNKNRPPFGSPRPVPSWATTNVTGHVEPGWERIAQSTFLLQQQIQECRGEIKGVPQLPTPGQSEMTRSQPPATPTPKRPIMPRMASGSQQDQMAPVQEGARSSADNGNAKSAVVAKASNPLYIATPAAKASGPLPSSAQPVVPVELAGREGASNGKSGPLSSPGQPTPTASKVTTAAPGPAIAITPVMPVEALQTASIEIQERPTVPQEQVRISVPAPSQPETPKPTQARNVPPPVVPTATGVAATQRETSAAAMSGEDVAIFEQLHHQLLLWLRVEAVQCGLDISGRNAEQLLDLLRQHGNIDETHLQVVSNLLDLTQQVLKNGQASLLDYKQAMMFHLMHTRSRRIV